MELNDHVARLNTLPYPRLSTDAEKLEREVKRLTELAVLRFHEIARLKDEVDSLNEMTRGLANNLQVTQALAHSAFDSNERLRKRMGEARSLLEKAWDGALGLAKDKIMKWLLGGE